MKILMLRFKNLNALQGEWQINFDDIGYQTDSFFSIIGPTGSGKSTILDAICLSLYGKTPRLDKITQSENLIMSQNTSECFAELIFKTSEGIFCTHWSHMRAHSKNQGKLQVPKHELSDWQTKKPITTKKNEVALKIITLIGLDFLQFTRAILLAQGQFSAFLNANPSDKGALLEKITGLEVYSELSKQSFENNKLIEVSLADKRRSLEHIPLLSAIELKALEDRINVLNTDNNSIKSKIHLLQDAEKNLFEIQDTQVNLKKVENNQQIQTSKHNLFEADARRLNNAQNALALESDYQNWYACNQNFQDTQDKLKTLNNEIVGLEKEEETVLISQAQMTVRLLENTREKECLNNVLQEVRGIDLMIVSLEQQIFPLLTDIQSVMNENTRLAISERDLIKKLDTVGAELQTHKKYLKNHSVLKSLHVELSGFKATMENLRNNKHRYQQYLQKKRDIDVEYAHSHQQLLKSTDIFAEFAAAYEQNLKLYDQAVTTFNTQPFILDDLLSHKKLVSLQYEQCERILSLHKKIISETVAFKAKQAEANECESHIKQLNLSIHTVNHDLGIAQNTLKLLIENDRLIQKINALEDERKMLKEGTPCPLCGSLAHPYIDAGDYFQSGLNIELQQCQNEVNQLVLQLAQGQADLKMYQKRKIDVSHYNMQQYENLCSELINLKNLCAEYNQHALAITADGCDFLPIELAQITFNTLEQLNLDNATQCQFKCGVLLSKIEKDILKYQSGMEEINRYNIECSDARKKLDNYKSIHQNHISVENTLMHTMQNLSNNLLELHSEIITKSGQLNSAIMPFLQILDIELNEINIEQVDGIQYVAALEAAFEKIEKAECVYQKATEKEFELEKLIVSLSGELANIQILSKEKRHYMISTEQNIANLKEKLSELVKKRIDLFGEKSCDEEAQRFELAALSLEAVAKKIDNELVTVTTQLVGLRRQFEQFTLALVTQAEAFEKAQRHLEARMQVYGFCDLTTFQNARLSQPDYERLLAESEQLNLVHHALMAQHLMLRTRLSDLEQVRVEKIQALFFLNEVGENREDWLRFENESLLIKIKNLINVLTNLLESNQNMTGQLESQCGQQYAYMKKHELIIDEIRALEITSQPIRLLNEWIGSADGKKYRNFAQSLSFEHMLHLGNQYLQVIDPRYEMTASIASPFEVMVRDTYQANHIRSSRTLSGGESFIISLALALGLSRMASKNILIETLFLDEGFGALDEGALDSVLAALNNLQQAGKMIGVISHVESMKERFANQIKVMPISNGLSVIAGVGVQRCA